MSFVFKPKNEQFVLTDNQWDGYTLILPMVSVGNVPQLATDLLINTLLEPSSSNDLSENDLEFAGYIYCKFVYQYAGPDAYSPLNQNSFFSTSIQVFVSKSKKLVVIQQRSPVIKLFKKEYCKELCQWLMRHQFGLILLLSSSFDQYLLPESIDRKTFPIKYLAPFPDQAINSHLEKNLNLTQIVSVNPETMQPDSNGKICLAGSGVVRSLIKQFTSQTKVNNKTEIVCIVMFCSEGDNRPHSFQMADLIADILNRNTVMIKPLNTSNVDQKKKSKQKPSVDENKCGRFNWRVPFSWRNLFGEEPPPEIF